jgi:hypothetical protein
MAARSCAALFFLLLLAGLCAANTNPCVPISNSVPIWTEPAQLLSTVSNGKLYRTTGIDPIFVLHVYGTPADWGTAAGQLLGNEFREMVYGELEHFYQEVQAIVNGSVASLPHFAIEPFVVDLISEVGIDGILDMLWKFDEPYISPYFKEEMVALANSTGIDVQILQRLLVGPEFTKAGCSMLGAWGSATPTGDLLQLRALDWDMTGVIQKYPLMTVYHPSDSIYGTTWVNIGWPVWQGVLSGASSNRMSISEKYGLLAHVPGQDMFFGEPFMNVLRRVLQYSTSLSTGLEIIQNANRTCSIWSGVGDGNADENQFRLVDYDYAHAINYTWSNSPITPTYPDVVYISESELCFYEQLSKFVNGTVTVQAVTQTILPQAQTGNLQAVLYDYSDWSLYVANAGPPGTPMPEANAWNRQYTRFDLASLFAETL